MKGNPKKFFTFCKSKKCDSQGVAPLKKNGLVHSDSRTKANILNHQFASVFTKENLQNLPQLDPNKYQKMPDITIDQCGVLKLLQQLNPHKASGPDIISTKLLKELATEICPALTLLFQACVSQGLIPAAWKIAHVTPIFKKGDRSKASNYRPVSLTSVTCKVLEHILHSNIITHFEQHNILTDAQYGFRKKQSCESQLIRTVDDLAKSLDDNEQVDAVLLDLSKAFDKVPQQRLLLKMDHYGVQGGALNLIGDFLNQRTPKVLVNGEQSETCPVTSGVPQGTVLGPLLFLAYINDMPECVTSTCRLFADDSLVYRRIKTPADAFLLQQDLKELEAWELLWQMSFNPDKCEVLRITNKRNPIVTNYIIHGKELATVKSAKYLGVTITSKLSWNNHVSNISKKANSTLAFLQRNTTRCPRHVKAMCYNTFIRPSLEYSSAVWSPYTNNNIECLEKVQR